MHSSAITVSKTLPSVWPSQIVSPLSWRLRGVIVNYKLLAPDRCAAPPLRKADAETDRTALLAHHFL